MPKFPRLIVAAMVTAGLTVALASQPAYAATKLTSAQARAILIRAAHHHGLNPNFVLAVSYWESGWNQAARSRTGAVGLMQVEPYTAAWAGPALLRSYLDQLHDPKLTLAAYYQGLGAVRRHGIYPSSRSYVDGIWKLRNQFQRAHLGG